MGLDALRWDINEQTNTHSCVVWDGRGRGGEEEGRFFCYVMFPHMWGPEHVFDTDTDIIFLIIIII